MRIWFSDSLPIVRRASAVIASLFVVAACSSPLAPDTLSSAPQATSSFSVPSDPQAHLTSSRVSTTFSLVKGSFTLTLDAADGSTGTVTGTYTGQAVVSTPGNTTAALDLQITNTSGIGSSITGLEADGTGAFVGEGDFTLVLGFELATPKLSDGVHAKLKGTSRISCSTSNRILVTQHGTDSTPKFVEITIDLQHEVAETDCIS